MTDSWTAVRSDAHTPSWSNRILVAAVAAIFFLTLYPFRFGLVRHGPPFPLAGWGKDATSLDAFLNILLFVPYGFGFAESLREHGRSRAAVLGIALLAGALLSYSVELLQFYIPMRDSGWGDVVTNSSGSVLGFFIYECAGAAILRFASRIESSFVTWLNWRRLTVGLLLYVGAWLAFAIHFQREVRIADWSPRSMLLIGSSGAEQPHPAWSGRVFEVEFWDRALAESVAKAITGGTSNMRPPPLASYNLSGNPPFQDQRHFLPDLAWARNTSTSPAWLVSRAPVSSLVAEIQRTNQFSLRVLCRPDSVVVRTSRIVQLTSFSVPVDLDLGQKGTSLTFTFRNPITANRPRLAWDAPNVFASDQPRNLLLSYDGSRLALYVDGKKEGRPYRLDPGTGLALFVRRVKSGELEGYHDIFYAIVFIPIGCLLGLGWRKFASQAGLRLAIMLFGVLVVPFLFEICIAFAANASVWLGNIILSLLLVLSGMLWVNADGRQRSPRPA